MNLVLVRNEELAPGNRVTLDGERARHVLQVLKAGPGATVRVGLLDGPLGQATVSRVAGERVVLDCAFEPDRPAVPRLDLLLALPRPKVLNRLWSQLAALGVGRIVLTNAAKVERCYFDSHVLSPAVFTPRLIEGLQQARDTRLPQVLVRRRFKPFVEDGLDALFPAGLRLVADPGGALRLGRCFPPEREAPPRVLLAVGPEGGWVPFELELLRARGFAVVGMGPRTLRTDTACIGLLSIVAEHVGA
ncbi:MAG TPA: RsmE family RNA methyltransferase [Candidatus Methanoperedens sp.]|nr:RsmE family RNA methyltransferase [Candidatus Methanoperedens sp.]